MMKDTRVLSRDGRIKGRIVGSGHTWCGACQRACRIGVRWEDGKLTRPCVRAMKQLEDGSWQLE